MVSLFPLGPDAGAQWENRSVEGDNSHPQGLLLIPDAGNASAANSSMRQSAVYYYLPLTPTLARLQGGPWAFSLTVVLSRMPKPDDEFILPLIERGQVALTLDLAVPGSAIDWLKQHYSTANAMSVSLRPLFARSLYATLGETNIDTPWATVEGAGADARLSFSATLNRTEVLAFITALQGNETDVCVCVDISYRAVEAASKAASAYGTTVVEQDSVVARQKTIALSTTLEALIGGLLQQPDSDQYVRLLAMSPTTQDLLPVPDRVGLDPASGTRDAETRLPVVVDTRGAQAIAMLSQAGPAAHAYIAENQPSRLIQPVLQTWMGHDLVVYDPGSGEQGESLPIVEKEDDPLWPDRVKAGTYWYAPHFNLVNPDINGDPQSSPYHFSFARVGHTATGKIGLEGAIQFTLRQMMSDATKEALNKLQSPPARPVALLDVAVYFMLPFRDSNGTTRIERFQAETNVNGDTVVSTVRLIDDWLRLAYGALAVKDYQSQPAQIVVSYCYSAYTSTAVEALQVHLANRDLTIPVISRGEPLDGPIYFEADTATYYHPQAAVQYVRETEYLKAHTRTNPVVLPAMLAQSALAIRPENLHSAVLQLPPNAGGRVIYSRVTHGINLALTVSYPCDTYGNFYLDSTASPATMIGCQEAFELGQVQYRQYALLDDADLQDSYCTIYRSLQQLDLFLIVPRRYCISRFGADQGDRAYRPIVYLYSLMDANTPDANHCDLTATLQPDIPPFVERDLRAKLARYTPQPTIRTITEIGAETTFAWSIPSAGSFTITPDAVITWNSFQVTLSTTLAGVLQLQAILQNTGLSGSATFKLSDGSSQQTELRLDLSAIVGPQPTGPLSVTTEGSTVHITNEIESAINVADVAFYPPAGSTSQPQTTAAETRLESKAVCTVNLPSGVGADWEIWPVYEAVPGDPASLVEIRTFMEDISTNVIFVNLVNFQNHTLKMLTVEGHIQSLDKPFSVDLNTDDPSADIRFVLPLTDYLAHQVLEFRVGKTMTDDSLDWTSPITWDLNAAGHIISLTWDMIV